LQKENWLYHRGTAGQRKATRIKGALRHAFYPDSASWKARVWEQGTAVVEQTLAGLSS
jgi:hypothetical protein